jgi:tetratricopeptide (TPR) repeat protein
VDKKKLIAILFVILGQLGCDGRHYDRSQILDQLAHSEAHTLNDTLIVLKNYLKSQPNDQEVRQGMAELLFNHQEYALALNQYDKLFKDGYNPELMFLRILQCQVELGAYSSLLEIAKKQPIVEFSDADQSEVQRILAIAYLRNAQLPEAQLALELARKYPLTSGLELVEAELALRQGDLIKSKSLLKEKADPDKEETKILLAALDFAQNDYVSASARYEGVLSRVKPSSRIYREQVIPYFFSLLQSNQTDVLSSYLESKKHKIPEGLWQFGAGLVDLIHNDWQGAQSAFLIAQKEIPLAQIDYFLALIHWRQDHNEQALLAIQRYLSQGENIKNALQLQAGIYLTMGDFSKSEAVLQQLLQSYPEDPVVLGFLAQVYYQSGHLDRWYQLLKQNPLLSQQHVLAYLATAIQLEKNDQFQQQLKELESHAFIDKQSAIHYDILQLLANSEFGLAKEKLDTLLQTDAQHPMTHQLLGLWALTHQDFTLASSAYEKAIELSPDNMGAVQQLAVVALKQQQTEKAKALLQRALKRHPDQLALTLTLAHAYVVEQNIDKAIQLAKNDIAAYPDHQGMRFFLASIYRQQQKFPQAILVLKEGLDKSPKDMGLLSQWIATKLLKHDFIEVKQALNNPDLGVLKLPLQLLALVLEEQPQAAMALLEQYPTQSEKMLSQVLAWLTEGQQLKTALPSVDLIIKNTPADNPQWLACAEVYLKTEQPKKALMIYEKILEISPQNPIARNNYDWLREQLNTKVL